MASNSKGRAIAGNFGKRFLNQFWSSYSISTSRGVHVSSYDKNLDEHVRPTVVPDEVINGQSDKYWGPHPKTGVFGPTDPTAEHTAAANDDQVAAAASSSVLDQKVWFRPLEDVDKPRHD